MTSLYNEIDAFCCAWLSNLMDAGHITPGKIDDRSIVDLNPDDVRGYERVHFFAGIGVWDYALGLAGWPDDRPVWTGSCPCQPFSAAGKQRGSDDERHLWPAFFRLIREFRPPIVIGEQVAGAAGLAWLDHVAADMEDAGYAVAAANIGAHSVGAPHLRQRLYWVAKSGESERGSRWAGRDGTHGSGPHREPAGPGAARIVADDDQDGRWRIEAPRVHERRDEIRGEEPAQRGAQGPRGHDADGRGEDGVLGDAWSARPERLGRSGDVELHRAAGALRPVRAAVVSHFWASVEWLPCRDGKLRPTQRLVQPLPDGIADRLGFVCTDQGYVLSPLIQKSESRVGRLRAYGNAIVAPLAAEFIGAVMECMP